MIAAPSRTQTARRAMRLPTCCVPSSSNRLGQSRGNVLDLLLDPDREATEIEIVKYPVEARIGLIDASIAAAVTTYQAASAAQEQKWIAAYGKGLDKATLTGSGTTARVLLPPGDYGPVPTLMDGRLALGQSGLLEGALLFELGDADAFANAFAPDATYELTGPGPAFGYETMTYHGRAEIREIVSDRLEKA